MLHIHNGDCSAGVGRKSSLPGDHFAFRESLATGPTPEGVEGTEWRRVRAEHLAAEDDRERCEASLLEQEQSISSSLDQEEIVLWFEHDLFCQVHLIYLLDRFSRHRSAETRFSLVCIDSFPGKENFRGLGELDPSQLASLFPERQTVTSEQFAIGSAAWKAFRSPTPLAIQTFLQTNSSALPFLAPALRAHLARFPSITNGLGHIENRGLQLIAAGATGFRELFVSFGAADPVYGFGDAQFWESLLSLSTAPRPLLRIKTRAAAPIGQLLTPDLVHNAEFELTSDGLSVLSGESDFVTLNGIDRWLGGVHLTQDSTWRWDDETKAIRTI